MTDSLLPEVRKESKACENNQKLGERHPSRLGQFSRVQHESNVTLNAILTRQFWPPHLFTPLALQLTIARLRLN